MKTVISFSLNRNDDFFLGKNVCVHRRAQGLQWKFLTSAMIAGLTTLHLGPAMEILDLAQGLQWKFLTSAMIAGLTTLHLGP
jgi:hypothetical protein